MKNVEKVDMFNVVEEKTTKKCKKCGEEKELSEYYKSIENKDNKSTWCKECEKTRAKEYRNRPEKKKMIDRYWREKNSDPERKKVLREREWKRAGIVDITFIKYEVMFKKQNGCCEICGINEKILGKLGVDHCHTTGKTRGLLCKQCNHILGNANDNIFTLKSAIKYLEESRK